MIATVLNVLGIICMFLGGFLFIVAAVGTLRMPDVYCRSHALAKALTFGIIFMLLGYGFRVPEASWFKIGIVIVFQLVTIPVMSHFFCLISYRRGARQWVNGEEVEVEPGTARILV